MEQVSTDIPWFRPGEGLTWWIQCLWTAPQKRLESGYWEVASGHGCSRQLSSKSWDLCTNTFLSAIRLNKTSGEKRSGRQAESRELPVPRVGLGAGDYDGEQRRGEFTRGGSNRPARHSSPFSEPRSVGFTTTFQDAQASTGVKGHKNGAGSSVFYPACYFLGLYRVAPPGLTSDQPRWSAHCLDFAASAAASAREQPHFLDALGLLRPWPCPFGILSQPLLSPLRSCRNLPTFPSAWRTYSTEEQPRRSGKPKLIILGSPTPSTGLDSNLPFLIWVTISTKSSASQSSQKERSRFISLGSILSTSHEFSSWDTRKRV